MSLSKTRETAAAAMTHCAIMRFYATTAVAVAAAVVVVVVEVNKAALRGVRAVPLALMTRARRGRLVRGRLCTAGYVGFSGLGEISTAKNTILAVLFCFRPPL